MIRRKRYSKLPLQANWYPVPTLIYIQVTVAFSPTESKILTGSLDAKVRVLTFDENSLAINEKTIVSFEEHSSKVNSVAFSPDGLAILSGANDKFIIIRNLDGSEVINIKNSTDVTAVALSPMRETHKLRCDAAQWE